MITNVDHPICVETCTDKTNKYLYNTEKHSLKYCVASCRLTVGKPYIDKITNTTKPECVNKCP